MRTNLLNIIMLCGFNESIVSIIKELPDVSERNKFKGFHLDDLSKQEKKYLFLKT